MSRTSQGPRLWKRPALLENGKIRKHAVWVIRDGSNELSTGCTATAREQQPPELAQQALANYIAEKYSPSRRARDIDDIDIADALIVYLDDRTDEEAGEDRHLVQCVGRLNDYFGGKTLSELNTKLCKGYVKTRPGRGGARRDLEILRAAINHHSKENLHYGKVSVWLPAKGEARERWLRRREVAAMIWKAYRYREVQTIHAGPNKGQKVITDRRPLRHVARFLLIGCYTGTRASAIASAANKRAPGKSFVDLERGLYYRKPIGKKATKKRQPPAPIPPRLLAHMRRWDRRGILCRIQWQTGPVRQKSLQESGPAVRAGPLRRQHYPAYLAPHRGHLVDAGACQSLGRGRLSRHDAGDARAHLWSPSS